MCSGLPEACRTRQDDGCLEKETGLAVDSYGKDLDFLRELVMDGMWTDAENFIKVSCDVTVEIACCVHLVPDDSLFVCFVFVFFAAVRESR